MTEMMAAHMAAATAGGGKKAQVTLKLNCFPYTFQKTELKAQPKDYLWQDIEI